MILSRKWLNEFIDLPLEECDDRRFTEAMSVSGSKVETTEDLSEKMKNVVAGRILSLEKHPNSDHMLVAQLDVGGNGPVQICTGAWNVHVGDMVPAALHNAVLPGGVKITRGKLRGVESEGMLCSLRELDATTHDFPYAAIVPAAILGDYHPLDPARPSVTPDILSGDRIFGSVIAAKVCCVENAGVNRWKCILEPAAEVVTDCTNLHEGDMVAYDTARGIICTPEDLHAKQEEFPHCISDGILILHEGCEPGTDIGKLLGMDDHVVEFEITPNRPDCLCVIGLAREAAVTFGKELRLHEPVVQEKAGDDIRNMANLYRRRYSLHPLHGAHGEKCEDCPVSRLDARAPPEFGSSSDQQHRGYHELCHA